jgi:succinate dehydrogenase / fumarate reductase cytochrome b subunit
MADASPQLRPRPISPHVQVWRWHVTMFSSIAHRVAGAGLYVGSFVLMAWALALAGGPDAYATFTGLAGSLIGKLVLFALTVCAFYHLANGVRHLAWDAGYGFAPRTASSTAWLVIAVAIVGAVGFWVLILTARAG